MALELDYMVTSWGRFLRDFPGLLAWLTKATMVLEAVGPLLALSPWATGPIRFAVVLVFVEFHLVGLGAALHLGIFPWIAACAWLLFLPAPPAEDGWFVMPGLLESGAVVDVWTGGEVRFDKPADVAASYRGGRWVKLLSNLSMSQYSGLRPPFVRWLCRGWNDQAPAGRRLTRVDLYFVMERFETPEAPAEPLFLLGAHCEAQAPE